MLRSKHKAAGMKMKFIVLFEANQRACLQNAAKKPACTAVYLTACCFCFFSQNPREADAMTKVQAELDETKIILVKYLTHSTRVLN